MGICTSSNRNIKIDNNTSLGVLVEYYSEDCLSPVKTVRLQSPKIDKSTCCLKNSKDFSKVNIKSRSIMICVKLALTDNSPNSKILEPLYLHTMSGSDIVISKGFNTYEVKYTLLGQTITKKINEL
jgi:hypothetical protein